MKVSNDNPVLDLSDVKLQIQGLDSGAVPSGILSLPIHNPLDDIKFKGIPNAGLSSHNEFAQCIYELKFGTIEEDVTLPSYSDLHRKCRMASQGKTVPMGLVHMNYHRLGDSARRRFSVQANRGEMPLLDQAVDLSELVEETVFMCRPMIANIPDGTDTVFDFSEEWVFDNTGEKPVQIEFDAGDGKGIRTIQAGEKIQVSYDEKGKKELLVRVTYANKVFETSSEVKVIALNLPAPDEVFDLTARHFYKHSHAVGKVRIYLSDKQRGLAKPLYFWTGFNTGTSVASLVNTPFDLMDLNGPELFAGSYDSFLKIALDNGYDIITLEWKDSRNYIQNNGFLAATLIQKINLRLPNTKNGVIVTGSMGGLIARWTALYMEHDEGKKLYGEHKIEKIITLDTPHEGAVMPMGLQYATDFIAANVSCRQGDPAREGVKTMRSPAARQMLVQLFRSGWPNQDEPKYDNERQILLDTWKGWKGYPKDAENYAISSGSRAGKGQTNVNGTLTLKPGDLLLKGGVFGLEIFRLRAMPNFPTRKEGLNILGIRFLLNPGWDAVVKKTLPYDSCPGGHWNFIPSLGNSLNDDKIMPFENTCFIPMVSSLGIKTNDLYMKVDVNTPTPFKKIYIPEKNERHATLNSGNLAFIMRVLGISAS